MPCKKASYPNEKVAMQEVERLRAKDPEKFTVRRAYLCNHCKRWHLTSQISKYEQLLLDKIESLEKDNEAIRAAYNNLMHKRVDMINENLRETISKLRVDILFGNNKIKSLEAKNKKLRTSLDKIMKEGSEDKRILIVAYIIEFMNNNPQLFIGKRRIVCQNLDGSESTCASVILDFEGELKELRLREQYYDLVEIAETQDLEEYPKVNHRHVLFGISEIANIVKDFEYEFANKEI